MAILQQSQNKVRPGAYLNFVSQPAPTTTIGDRGIVIIPLQLNWGDSDKLIEVYSTDMLNGKSLAKVGVTAFDEEAKLLTLALSNAYKALVHRTNSGGIKASAILGTITATAKYSGTFGNKLQVAIVDVFEDETVFDVKVYIDAILRTTQRVSDSADLKENDFITFSGTGDLVAHAGQFLTGGTNGTVATGEGYTEFLERATLARWQTMAVMTKTESIKKIVHDFISNQRDPQNKFVQAVINDYDADHEGIINSTMGAVINGIRVEPHEFCAWVAGATAGASMTESLTARVIPGATEIIGELDNDGIIEALNNGEFILSRNQDGKIKAEQDINSFLTVVPLKNYSFRKNRVIRVIDQFGTEVVSKWEDQFMGKVGNSKTGRAIFKGEMVYLGNRFQNLGAIEDFAGASDIDVDKGIAIDDVVAGAGIKPIDSMEKLYLVVNLRS